MALGHVPVHPGGRQGDLHGSAAVHRVGRVGDQVHHDLVDQVGVGHNGTFPRLVAPHHLHRRRDARTEDTQALLHRSPQIDSAGIPLGLAAERQDLPDQFLGPLRAGQDAFQIIGCSAMGGHFDHAHFGVSDHGGQDVVEVVGDASGEGAQGFQFLCMPEVLFDFHLPGDVPQDEDEVGDLTGFGGHGRYGQFGLIGGTVLAGKGPAAGPHLPACPDGSQDLQKSVFARRIQEKTRAAVQGLAYGKPCDPLERGIGVLHPAFGREDHNGLCGLLHGRAELGEPGLDRFFSVMSWIVSSTATRRPVWSRMGTASKIR